MKNIRLKKFKTSVFGIMFGISLGFGYEEFYGIGTWHSFETPTQSMNVYFTDARYYNFLTTVLLNRIV